MNLEIKNYLLHIQIACEDILEITQGKSFADYTQEKWLRLAVERLLTIIGEAVAQMRKLAPTLTASLENHERIVACGMCSSTTTML